MADVTRLLKSGNVSEALAKTNQFLAKHPADPQMRFMKGVLLTEQNKTDEAIAVFTKLTEDYKDLPEPYNNLAVLYASSGQYDKARIALEKAIRTNPSYMTAYENLGDVYGKMASQAYDKALALGTTPNTAAKSKLTLLRTFSSSTGSKLTVPEVPGQAPAAVAQAKPAPSVVAQAGVPSKLLVPTAPDTSKSAPPPAAQTAPKPAPTVLAKVDTTKTAAAATVVAKTEPPKAAALPPVQAKPAAPPPAPKAPDNSAERDEVLNQVHAWAKAWSNQDVDGYLGYYSNDFEAPKGMTRKAWAAERRSRIAGKGRIHVEVTGAQVTITNNTAKVSFRQVYESDRLSANSHKTLTMVKNGGKWQIKQESTGS